MNPLEDLTAHRAPHQIDREIDSITKLMASPGWQMVADALLREERKAVSLLCEKGNSSPEDLHYYRATARAIRVMIELPSFIRGQLQNELEFASKFPAKTEPKEVKSNGS